MNKCYEIFKEKEIKSEKQREEFFQDFLYEFLESYDVDFNLKRCSSYESKVKTLKYEYIYDSQYLEVFLDMLYKYGYNDIEELRDSIHELGWIYDECDYEQTKDTLLHSPVIDDITLNGSVFKIYSEKYGEFSFELADAYFENNSKISDYMIDNVMPQYCHYHTYLLSKWLPQLYGITSYMPSYFDRGYYHSYSYDSDKDLIIDLCHNCIMDKKTHDKLFSPRCISKVLNSEMKKELTIVNKKIGLRKPKAETLRIALYKEYLSSIGYTGSLEDAPSLKKSIFRK